MAKNEVNGFTFFRSYYESLCEVEDEKDKNELINAIFYYIFDDKVPKFKGTKKIIWTLIEPNLSTSKKRSNAGKVRAKHDDENENQNEIKTKSNENQKGNKREAMTSLSFPYPIPFPNPNPNKEEEYINTIFKEYIILREEKDYTISDGVITRLLNKLKDKNIGVQKEMLENAIDGGWKSFYVPEGKENDSSNHNNKKNGKVIEWE